MDQLKPYLIAIKKHHFWILLATALVTALVVWYSATTALDEKFLNDKRKNDSAFSQIMPIRGDAKTNSPPNAKYKEAVDKKTDELAVSVVDAWRQLFDRQKSVLYVNDRIPELVPYLTDEKLFQKDIPPNIRDVYHNTEVIEQDFRELFKILNLRRPAGVNPVDEGGPAANPVAGAQPEGVLLWAAKPSPRNVMLRYKTVRSPSTVRIRMTQEDLWVFRSMFKVLAAINSKPVETWLSIMQGGADSAGAVDQANVPIKQINFCDLAQYAMAAALESPGKVQIGAEDINNPANAAMVGGGGGFSVGTTGSAEEDAKLTLGRYIDGRNQPVSDPTAPPFSEFKQMFVQMTVLMDQRLIPVLIAECANADLTIETRQVQVDLRQVDVLRQADAAQAAQQANKVEQSPHDVLVTIRGVVFGYSPPDKARIGQGSDPDPSKRNYGIPTQMSESPQF